MTISVINGSHSTACDWSEASTWSSQIQSVGKISWLWQQSRVTWHAIHRSAIINERLPCKSILSCKLLHASRYFGHLLTISLGNVTEFHLVHQNEGAKTYLRRSLFLRHRHHCLHPAANHVSGSRHTLDSIKVSISTLGQTSQSSVDMKDNTNVSASSCWF